mmetsp:Transcript_34292/g.25371  ORF Transcript_34292/g.25371 Transcript_34292/m.25371 type:complete len:85 (-) Transcript_34292:3399-3653(-)
MWNAITKAKQNKPVNTFLHNAWFFIIARDTRHNKMQENTLWIRIGIKMLPIYPGKSTEIEKMPVKTTIINASLSEINAFKGLGR